MKRLQISLAVSPCLSLVAVAVNQRLAAYGTGVKAPQLKLLKTIPLGGAGKWDYLYVDRDARRLYLPRTTHVQVVDLDKGVVVDDIPNISAKGAHGVALAPEQNLGFISAGRDDRVVVFDIKTLKVTGTIKTGANPDAILYDPASKHIFAMNHTGGDVTVIDPAALDKTVSVPVGGKLEYAVADGAGHVFVCVEDKNEVVQIDSKANRVLARWRRAKARRDLQSTWRTSVSSRAVAIRKWSCWMQKPAKSWPLPPLEMVWTAWCTNHPWESL
jgi:YVTN family beta-propeller protein